MSPKSHSSEERRRLWEVFAMVLVTLSLVGLSRLETRLFELSKTLSSNAEFFTSVIYFGLININVVLILVLSFLIFRNIAKLVLERRRGVLGSKLRAKLVVTLVFFALAPTILMFYISSSFITTSFDTWFSSKVKATMEQTREAGAQVYKQDQRRLESLARIALQRVDFEPFEPLFPGDRPKIDASRLAGFENEYRLEGVKVFDVNGELVWSSFKGEEIAPAQKSFVLESLERFQTDPSAGSQKTVEADETRDVVKGSAPIFYGATKQLVGVVVTEEHFETQILKSIENILAEFAGLRPGAQLIRLSYLILLVVMVLIIVFSTTWLGFYVAKGIVTPIQHLAEATREVALGNYNISLQPKSDDETGALVRAFNKMTNDLRAHEEQHRRFTTKLQTTNDELNRRSEYIEVVLKNITSGVFTVDASGRIASFNSAAERLLDLKAVRTTGRRVEEAFGPELHKVMWEPIYERIQENSTFNGGIDLRDIGRGITLIAAGIQIFDGNGDDLGIVIVFDDATEQTKAQRVAAWREVARRIAHEIKNPITPIKLSAQRLLRRYGENFVDEDRKVFESCIETILTQVDSLRDLVNEFSRFSRMPTIKTADEDVNDIICDVVNLYGLSYPGITFETVELSADIPKIAVDREQINRVLMNLVSNSVAAVEGQEGSRVEIRTQLMNQLNAVRIEISDNGRGIPSSQKEKVFDPYFSTKKEGTGLGLSIVQQVVSEHGGYIRIVDGEPRGTVVIIDLPIGEQSVVERSQPAHEPGRNT